ncbi:hypothetical protein Tco_1487711 [Tanacetum coccineum]
MSNAVIDCKKAKIKKGEWITRSVFGVKGIELGEEEAPYWTTLGKREPYKPRPSSDGMGARTRYYARKEFIDCHLPIEWEITRDAEINPFNDVLKPMIISSLSSYLYCFHRVKPKVSLYISLSADFTLGVVVVVFDLQVIFDEKKLGSS